MSIDNTIYQVVEVSRVAFRLCDGLTGVNIQENVRKVDDYAFIGCANITEIILPASLESLGAGVFSSCYKNLQTVTCLGSTPPRWEYNDVFKSHEKGIGDDLPALISADKKLYVPDENELIFSNSDEGGLLSAGHAYMIVVNRDTLSLDANRVTLTTQPFQGEDIYLNGQVVGKWKGIFTPQTNDWAVEQHAYGMSSDGNWKSYSNADSHKDCPHGMRAIFCTKEATGIESYPIIFNKYVAGDNDETLFPADEFDNEINFSPFSVGIVRIVDSGDSSPYYELHGRRVVHPTKGIYIHNGRKVLVK